MTDRRDRIEAALWGLFIADALAMPAHWFYSRENIVDYFDGGITGYVDPPHPHPEAFMVGMGYHPDLATAKALGRPFDIVHEHVRFYQTSWSELEIARTARDSEHGNAVPAAEERYHYHHGLKAGENTLNAHLARVLMRSVIKHGSYEAGAFLDDFISHMTTPGLNKDPYTEIFVRRWFENWCGGASAHAAAQMQRDNWSIGSLGGLIRPMVLSLLSANAYQGIGLAIEHQALTHRSETVSSGLAVCVPILFELIDGVPAGQAVPTAAKAVHSPRISGENLYAAYRAAEGPANIPDDQMWTYHMELADRPIDLDGLVAMGEQTAIGKQLGTVCYVEQGLPMMFFLGAHESYDFEKTLLLNVNAGGDNVSRGMPLGILTGAAAGRVPTALKTGLADHEELAAEISAFTDIAVSGTGVIANFEAPSRRTAVAL